MLTALLFVPLFSLAATPFEDASGFVLQVEAQAVLIASVNAGSAADDAGIHVKDELLHVDGKAVAGLAPDKISDVVKEKGGVTHHLVLKREGKPRLVTLKLKQPV